MGFGNGIWDLGWDGMGWDLIWVASIIQIMEICMKTDPMKKDHPTFVQFLFKSIQKTYDYCNFLDKNKWIIIYNVLKMCNFNTI